MSLIQQPLERKLSALMGAEVTFEKLNISLLGGSINANGIVVAGRDGKEPVLTIRRLRAEVSPLKALKKEIAVKAVEVEGLVLNIVRGANGEMNLPRREIEEEEVIEPAAPRSEAREETSWEFSIERIRLTDGAVSFEDRSNNGTYRIAAEGINADLRHADEKLTFNITSESCGRQDLPVDLGPLRLAGRIINAPTIEQLRDGKLDAAVELNQIGRGSVGSDDLRSPKFDFEFDVRCGVSMLLRILPPATRLNWLNEDEGNVSLTVRASYSRDQGFHIAALNLSAENVKF